MLPRNTRRSPAHRLSTGLLTRRPPGSRHGCRSWWFGQPFRRSDVTIAPVDPPVNNGLYTTANRIRAVRNISAASEDGIGPNWSAGILAPRTVGVRRSSLRGAGTPALQKSHRAHSERIGYHEEHEEHEAGRREEGKRRGIRMGHVSPPTFVPFVVGPASASVC